MTTHILPINDSEPHEEATTCKCKPSVEILEDGGMMVVHNSFDRRERIEELIESAFNNCS